MRILTKIITFFQEVRLEVKRVNWPTQKQVTQNTLIVIGIAFLVSIFLGFVDFIFTTLLINRAF